MHVAFGTARICIVECIFVFGLAVVHGAVEVGPLAGHMSAMPSLGVVSSFPVLCSGADGGLVGRSEVEWLRGLSCLQLWFAANQTIMHVCT